MMYGLEIGMSMTVRGEEWKLTRIQVRTGDKKVFLEVYNERTYDYIWISLDEYVGAGLNIRPELNR